MNSRKAHTIGRNRGSTECVRERILHRAARAVLRPALAIALLSALLLGGVKPAPAQTLTVLHAFTGTDGSHPQSGLVADASGNLYGAGYDGGTYGYGTVIEVTPSGGSTVLHNFTGADGDFPTASLVRDAQGNLYGTTSGGGSAGGGTVFMLTPSGTETVLLNFTGPNGDFPASALVQDSQGNFFGTTFYGGAYGYGEIYAVHPPNKPKVLYNFTGGLDGVGPYGSLILDAQGNLYGTTLAGGLPGMNGYGTVFAYSPSLNKLRALYTFVSGRDGWGVYGNLVLDAQGDLYGATYYGGAHGYGAVFEVLPTGKDKVLYTFTGGADGANPYGGLVQDAKGNLYGTTTGGGANGYGTVFMVTPSGTETVLYSFTGGSDGATPYGGVIRDAKGRLYGTTKTYGANGVGTVFRLSF
jgi:uncharacterized repeat protein (TIGR03803 family)